MGSVLHLVREDCAVVKQSLFFFFLGFFVCFSSSTCIVNFDPFSENEGYG